MKWLLLLISTLPLTTVASDTVEDSLTELARLLAGEFESRSEVSAEEQLVDRRIQLHLPILGKHVFYQQINSGPDLKVYRQRVVVLSISADGTSIEQHSYSLKNPTPFVEATAAHFSKLSEMDLIDFMPDGCEQIWTKIEGGFRGYVDPRFCRVVSTRASKLRAIEAESIVRRDSLSLVERGYDPNSNEQLFGTPQGDSTTLRRVR